MQSIPGNANVDITKMLAELREGFLADLPARLEEIEDIILAMRSSGSFTEDYEALYRHIHSLKGSSGTHGLHIISTVCHAFEDVIIEIDGDQSLLTDKHVTNWLAYIDLLRKALDLISAAAQNFAEIEESLDALRGRGSEFDFRGLLVMNSELHRKLCLSAFEGLPVKFSYSNSGYEALGLLIKEPYDLLITNMEVSDLQGLPLISALRISTNRNSKIPSVLLTSGSIEHYNKKIDPDYVIKKDEHLMEGLNKAAKEIVSQLRETRVDD